MYRILFIKYAHVIMLTCAMCLTSCSHSATISVIL